MSPEESRGGGRLWQRTKVPGAGVISAWVVVVTGGVSMVTVSTVAVPLHSEADTSGELTSAVMAVTNVIPFVLLMSCASVPYWYSLYFTLPTKKKKSFEKPSGKFSLVEHVFLVI